MRLAHVGDLHIGGARIEDHRAYLDAILADALRAEPDLWLLTGDLWGTTVPHASTVAERAVLYPAIVRMAEVAPVVVVVGNHDSAADLAVLPHLGGRFPIIVAAEGARLRVETSAGVANVYALPYPSRAWLLRDSDASGAEARAATEAALSQLLTAWGAMIRARRARAPHEVHILAAHVQVSGAVVGGGGEVLDTGEITVPRSALDDLPIDYGALGHLHIRQEAARRCWYAGSPWPTSHGGTVRRHGWNLVDVGGRGKPCGVPRNHDGSFDFGGGGDLPTYSPLRDPALCLPREVHHARLYPMLTPHRALLTLTWSWGEGGWLERPDHLDVAGAEVRCLLTVAEAFASSCPWPAELARVKAAGAERVVVERRTIPSTRVRAPAVAAAETPEAKLRAWWATLDTPPNEAIQAAAIDALRVDSA